MWIYSSRTSLKEVAHLFKNKRRDFDDGFIIRVVNEVSYLLEVLENMVMVASTKALELLKAVDLQT